MIASIPYRTFPEFHIGPIPVHTFGVMVALGFFVGTWSAACTAEGLGMQRDRIYSLATRILLWSLVGSRVAWDLSHVSELHSPVDLIAVWNGGLAFTGGFAAATIVAILAMRTWEPVDRWLAADAIALGLTVGLAIGRIGCYSVGEHLGHPTSFFLGVRYLGGVTREGPLTVGVTYQSTALYEFLHLVVLGAILWWVLYRRRGLPPGTAIGIFCLWYGVARFSTDFLRAYDERVLGLTAAQYLCLFLAPTGAWILARGRVRRSRLAAGTVRA